MANDSERKAHLTKIQKLLALASSANEHEAESARMFAKRLMKKYGITEKEVGESSGLVKRYLLFERGSHLTHYEMELATMITYFHDCVAVFQEHPDPERVFVVGNEEAVKEVKEQFLWLLLEINRAAAIAARKFSRSCGFYWKRSFWAGVLDSLDVRLEKLAEPEEEVFEEDEESTNWIRNLINKFKGKIRVETVSTSLVKQEQSEFKKVEDYAKDELKVDYKDIPGKDLVVDGLAYKTGKYTGENIELNEDERKQLLEGAITGG